MNRDERCRVQKWSVAEQNLPRGKVLLDQFNAEAREAAVVGQAHGHVVFKAGELERASSKLDLSQNRAFITVQYFLHLTLANIYHALGVAHERQKDSTKGEERIKSNKGKNENKTTRTHIASVGILSFRPNKLPHHNFLPSSDDDADTIHKIALADGVNARVDAYDGD